MAAQFGAWVQSLSLFTAVRESQIAYPAFLSTHLACIAVFGGLILVGNLRLFGLVLRDRSIGEVMTAFRPWKQFGFALMITMGVLLAGSKGSEYFTNPYFQIKTLLLLLIGVHGLAFRGSVYRNPDLAVSPNTPSRAKLAGVLSIVLWLGVISMGRWIAYFDRPEPNAPAQTSLQQPR
jgi:hypothetical protein